MDFFTVITANSRILYCLFLIQHNAERSSTFPESTDDQYLIFDRDAKFSAEMHQFLDSAGISAIRTSYRSPWQNGIAERWFEVFGMICSTTSSFSMRPISGALHGTISAIITPIAPTMD